MPIYEFQCTRCGQRFEEIIPVSQTTTPQCPQCKNNEHVEKLVSLNAPGAPSKACAPRSGFS